MPTDTVLTVATSAHHTSLHQRLIGGAGFAHSVDLRPPKTRDRIGIVHKILHRYGCDVEPYLFEECALSSSLYEQLTQRTEGCRPADLELLCKRILACATTRINSGGRINSTLSVAKTSSADIAVSTVWNSYLIVSLNVVFSQPGIVFCLVYRAISRLHWKLSVQQRHVVQNWPHRWSAGAILEVTIT